MSGTILRHDAGFRWTENGSTYLHHLSARLQRPTEVFEQDVSSWSSADLTTIRRVSIGSGVRDLKATIRYDGDMEHLNTFLAAARRGAALEYFPSFAAAESYPCVLMAHSEPEPDPHFWWDKRFQVDVHLRRIDGGDWRSPVTPALFYYRSGNDIGATFTRSGAVGPYVDEFGVLQSAAANVARTDFHEGVPYLLLEAARTNLVSDDDLTNWSTVGTPVVTGSVSDPAGGTSAYTVEDNSAASLEEIYLPVTFTGDGDKVLVFTVRENTMPSSGAQTLLLWDDTIVQRRFDVDITSWSDGEPILAAPEFGTVLGKRYVGNGYWKIYALADSVVAASDNRIYVYPASLPTETGSIDVYRINAYNAETAWSVLDAGEVKNADAWSVPFTAVPQ